MDTGLITQSHNSSSTQVVLPSGKLQKCCFTLPRTRTHNGSYKYNLTHHAIQLHGIDAILRKRWFGESNPRVDWKQNTIQSE